MTTRPWITDRPPTRDDADKESRVELAKYPEGDSCVQVNWKQVGSGTRWRVTKHWRDPIQDVPLLVASAHGTCNVCRYWQKWAKPGGECRRNAPKAAILSSEMLEGDSERWCFWPGTDPDDWCGEWEAKS